MNRSVKARWLEKLRSDDYTQTSGYLARDGGFCCLGVLCEVAVEDGTILRRTPTDEFDGVEYYDPNRKIDYSTRVLPEIVQRWSEFSEENPVVLVSIDDIPPRVKSDLVSLGIAHRVIDGVTHYSLALAELNDTFHLTFSEIADIVEKYL